MTAIVYERLTKKQLDYIANGCGPKYFGLLVPDDIFREACLRHDVKYWVGNTETDRYSADKSFLAHMLYLANKQYWRRWWRFRANVYYRTVRVLGRWAFYRGPRKRTLEDLIGEMSYHA